jgi:hypothetical protein
VDAFSLPIPPTVFVRGEDGRIFEADFVSPTVDRLVGSSGPEEGGTDIRIYGSGFTNVTTVSFGTAAARRFQFVNDTEIFATSPSSPGGFSSVTEELLTAA